MNDIKGFTFYQSYYEALEDLNVDDKKEILNAMFEFVFEDKEPSSSKRVAVVAGHNFSIFFS